MGNRVKNKPKKKSIKAAVHSGMATHRKLSRMGKVQKKNHAGIDATFIGRAKVLKKLQISLKDFRRLCILKGVYPREPRGRAPKNKKGQVFYHIKDVKALAHEPLLEKFREFKTFMKKVRRSANRNEKDEARRKQPLAPKYTLHHLVRERYPRFADALGDLDDALCLVHLFACLPSDGRIQAGITRKAQQLAASWGAYCSATGSIVKSFISVKGVYVEAEIMTSGQSVPVRWVTPHNFTQHIPQGVDFRVMLTFFEFYETLVGFVLYKLYGELGVQYPLPTVARAGDGVSSATLHPTLGGKATSVLAANLSALQIALNEASKGNSAVDAVKDALQNEDTASGDGQQPATASTSEDKKAAKATKKKQKKLMKSIDEALKGVKQDDESDVGEDEDMDQDEEDQAPIAAPLREALEAIDDSALQNDDNNINIITDPEAQKRHQLFNNLTFFLSREVPRGYLELIILSYGGKVGWEGQDSPIAVEDSSITHHIIDRPKLLASYSKLPKSREYIQPQWILDCANFTFVLPIEKYGVGSALPPHLSPWVDDKEEGYVPKYKEDVEKLRNGEVLDASDEETEMIENDAAKDESSSEEEEEVPSARVLQKDNATEGDESESSEEEEDDEEAGRKASKKKQTEDEEAAHLGKALMSKKAARLYGRMQHGIAEKQSKIDNLHKKRRVIEDTREKSKDGKTILKLKVERLKQERRDKEDAYKNTGGSMKKKRKKN
mmetsp:Transcript_18742/g.34538  ORF Transcript_18742/g.34538 Transcript_18742/m.34538 type:complete len:724 (-) Transcript_18742:232-2403(-)|eukprot:CAMPEP_0201884620 /NCGR_PEP_ID=MMETSP0902-20130614/17459_1 /ASSEMBLY_ACC=CAM_ASM_000551 /TAXON_ID=420261 /ORGANISM="Thalassiosira antarctica, Strain CCMP982" /LENGTH=723 /DNA_ID=CAMNT_0048413615 /DNA_START=102 /DNA_END=2273 /DNA_ORIENTATION=-